MCSRSHILVIINNTTHCQLLLIHNTKNELQLQKLNDGNVNFGIPFISCTSNWVQKSWVGPFPPYRNQSDSEFIINNVIRELVYSYLTIFELQNVIRISGVWLLWNSIIWLRLKVIAHCMCIPCEIRKIQVVLIMAALLDIHA